MGFFVITCIDRSESLELRLATRARHLDYLAEASNIRLAGPFLNSEGTMIGSMLIIEAESLEQAQQFAAQDPYAIAGLFETSSVRAWRQTAGDTALPLANG